MNPETEVSWLLVVIITLVHVISIVAAIKKWPEDNESKLAKILVDEKNQPISPLIHRFFL
jgi:hypothetical protein